MQSTLLSHKEVETDEAFSLQNNKLLKVRLDKVAIQAKKGSMVAYRGEVNFEAASSGGVGKFIKKQMTGEGQDLMKMSGTGEVFLADLGQDVHLLRLENDGLSCNGANVLAFDAGIQHDIERVKGMGMLSGGFFNMTLQGTGWVALVSEGQPVVLDTGGAPTFADPQAVVCWSQGIQTSFKKDLSGGVKNILRGGSGETFQMGLMGDGWVIVQPSEGVARSILAQVPAR